MALLNDQRIIYKKYFGFQKGFSTAHTIISLIDYIEKAMDNNLFVSKIFIDLQKAFGTIDHNILFHKLSHYRIRYLAKVGFHLISLIELSQFVTINGFNSETHS